MGLARILQHIWNHPMNEGGRVAAVGRFARWQLGSRLLGQPCLLPFATDGVLVTSRGDTGATGNYYCGVHEYPDMPFVAHALEPGDLFVDAGANVGAYTVLAGAVAGADVVSCEPVPSTFSKLQRNVAANMLQDRVTACHTAVGRKPGECRMTSGRDAMNHVVAEGEAASDVVTVPVSRIDDLVPAGRARMMKMDVEGFEREALAGAERLLSEASLLAVLIEMNGAGRRYGVEDAELDETLRKAGLAPATYDPVERALTPASTFGSRGNTLYVRESEELAERLRRSEPLRAFGRAV